MFKYSVAIRTLKQNILLFYLLLIKKKNKSLIFLNTVELAWLKWGHS